jgi:hypothetical protein
MAGGPIMILTLRILIAGRERLALPYLAEHNDAVEASLHEFWPAFQRLGRVTVIVDDGEVLHFIGGTR